MQTKSALRKKSKQHPTKTEDSDHRAPSIVARCSNDLFVVDIIGAITRQAMLMPTRAATALVRRARPGRLPLMVPVTKTVSLARGASSTVRLSARERVAAPARSLARSCLTRAQLHAGGTSSGDGRLLGARCQQSADSPGRLQLQKACTRRTPRARAAGVAFAAGAGRHGRKSCGGRRAVKRRASA